MNFIFILFCMIFSFKIHLDLWNFVVFHFKLPGIFLTAFLSFIFYAKIFVFFMFFFDIRINRFLYVFLSVLLNLPNFEMFFFWVSSKKFFKYIRGGFRCHKVAIFLVDVQIYVFNGSIVILQIVLVDFPCLSKVFFSFWVDFFVGI